MWDGADLAFYEENKDCVLIVCSEKSVNWKGSVQNWSF